MSKLRRRAPMLPILSIVSPSDFSRRQMLRALAGVAVAAAAAPTMAATTPDRVLRYRADHPVFGKIGTYVNSIAAEGGSTTVETEIHIIVAPLGLVLHRENAKRIERWSGDRLVAFEGHTTVNGTVTEILGEAVADGFAITSPQGRVVAPSDVRPSNPWSAGLLKSSSMMQTDTGQVETVEIKGPEPARIRLGEAMVETQRYQIAAGYLYAVWFDGLGVPLMFSIDDHENVVRFSLVERS